MYASQSKRLCVREASTEDTRAQSQSTSSSDAGKDLKQQQQTSTTSSSTAPNQDSTRTSTPETSTAPITRSSSRASQLVSGSSSGGKRAHDKLSGTSSMTASATGNTAGDENESPVKHAAASLINNHLAQAHRVPPPSPPTSHIPSHEPVRSEVENEEHLIQKLANETREEVQLELILSIRNLITACNKKKTSLSSNPNLSKIIRLIDSDKNASLKVRTQLALLLCSISKGGEQNIKVLNGSFVDDKLINLILTSQDDRLIEACLRCLRAMMSWPRVSRAWLLYDEYSGQNPASPRHQANNNDKNLNGPQKIIEYALTKKSFVVQECIADIFAATCCRDKDQMILYNVGAVQCLAQLIESTSTRVVKSALNWLAALCLRNSTTSHALIKSTCPSGESLMDRLIALMGKNENQEIQFLSSKCYALIYKSLAPLNAKSDQRITNHVLPTFVRMVHKDKPSKLRSESAECIASLVENDIELQRTASTCDHLIESLADMLEYDDLALCDIRDYTSQLFNYRKVHWNAHLVTWYAEPLGQKTTLSPSQVPVDTNRSPDLLADSSVQEMRRTAFLALAALASNLEVIRKKILDTCSVMKYLVRGLTDPNPATLKSVLACLLSLSRSVQQLRTSFPENNVYNALKNLLNTSSNEVLILVLSILCNISLDFSPGRQHFLDPTTIGLLCNITKGTDPFVRLHGMWILMNMVYQLKEPQLKFEILSRLGHSHVLSILETENDEALILKTLGFLRNLLSPRAHIDEIMKLHGKSITRAIQACLDRSSSTRVRVQALCVLTNIADGNESKSFIMQNRAILDHLTSAICDDKADDVRLAAITCITNLVHKDQEGFQDRQNEIRRYGIQDKLKTLLNTNDTILADRVRTAYNQFLQGINDKFVN